MYKSMSMFHKRAFLCLFVSNMAPCWARKWWKVQGVEFQAGEGNNSCIFFRQILVQWIMRLEWSWWRQVHWCLLVGSWCWRTWTKAGLVWDCERTWRDGLKMGWYAGGWRAHGIFGWYLRRGIGLNPSPHMEKMGSPLHLAWIYGRPPWPNT